MLRGNGFENFLKIVAIYITMFISTVIISGIDHTGDMYIGGSQYSTYIGKHLMISYIIFLILIIVFKVENNAVNIYLINWIVLKNLTQYSFFIMLSYFITLSILHRVLIKFINIIKNKLNRLK